MVGALKMRSIFNSPLLCSKSGVVIQQQHQSQMYPCLEVEGFKSLSKLVNVPSKENKYTATTALTLDSHKQVSPSQECTEEGIVTSSSGLSKFAMATHIEEELKRIDINCNADDCTQGSDTSKCSFGFEKPKGKVRLVRSDPATPVPDITLSKIKASYSEDRDNTTCTWSDSDESSIPAFIYIRRDIPPAVPDDEALGQQYSMHGRKMEETSTVTGLFLKGLRIFTFGGFGKNIKAHLDDDASEAFKQTFVEL